MNTIIICGDHSDRVLTKTIVGACLSCGGALVCDSTGIKETQADPQFLVLCVDSLTDTDCKGIIVFGEATGQASAGVCMNGVIAVADSGGKDAVSLLSDSEVTVIGCSSSGRDTLTISCRDDRQTIASLQRSIKDLSGKVIEPCEISLLCDGCLPLYPALAACAALLLCGVPYENGYDLRYIPD